MLNIVKEIKETSLAQVVAKYKLLMKPCGHKFLLKYNQIESYEFKLVDAVRECRGLILSNDLEVMAYSFKRFFNLEEEGAAKIDLSKASILKKEDGSMMTLYWDFIINEWCVQTTGVADANTNVGEYTMTFADLFWTTFNSYGVDMSMLNKKQNYVFEMCSAHNQVVKYHAEPKLVLLNVRYLSDLSEATYDELVNIGTILGLPVVEVYDLNSIDGIRELFNDMTKEDEGFIAYDGVNRVKIKNPAYVMAHKMETNFSPKDIFTIVKEKEGDEFVGILTRYADLYNQAEKYFNILVDVGTELKSNAVKLKETCLTKKDFVFGIAPYINVENKIFLGYVYKFYDGNDFDVRSVLCSIDNKKLYEMMDLYLYKNSDI